MCFCRYEGESKEKVKDNTDHLSNLLKLIEERKRQRSVANNESISQDIDKNNVEKYKKKKKWNKNLHDGEEINNLHIKNKSEDNEKTNKQSLEVVEAPPKSKKRRRKDSKNEDDSLVEHLEIQDQELEKTNGHLQNEEENNNNKDTMKNETSSQNNFMVLGAKHQKKQRAVKRVLPDWLAHPEVISGDLNSGPNIEDLHSILDPKLIEILKANGIVKLFPVQSNVIKWLHTCNKDRRIGWWLRDTCVSAPTGSGKY